MRRKSMSGASKGTALVTGASSGIGAIYAERLAARGYDLILVARNQERLAVLAKHLADQYGRKVEVIVADLAGDGLARVEAVLKQNASINLFVNNAGIGAAGPLLASDVDQMGELIAINRRAPLRPAHAAPPPLLGRGGGGANKIRANPRLAPGNLQP